MLFMVFLPFVAVIRPENKGIETTEAFCCAHDFAAVIRPENKGIETFYRGRNAPPAPAVIRPENKGIETRKRVALCYALQRSNTP